MDSSKMESDVCEIKELIDNGEHGQAEMKCRKLIHLEDVGSEIHYCHGVALAGMGRHKEAIKAFSNALDKKKAVSTYLERSGSYLATGELDDAKDDLDDAQAIATQKLGDAKDGPDDAQAIDRDRLIEERKRIIMLRVDAKQKALKLKSEKKYSECIKMLETLCEDVTHDPTIYLEISKCYENLGETRLATMSFQRAIDTMEGDGEKCLYGSLFRLSRGDTSGGLDNLRRYVSLNSEDQLMMSFYKHIRDLRKECQGIYDKRSVKEHQELLGKLDMEQKAYPRQKWYICRVGNIYAGFISDTYNSLCKICHSQGNATETIKWCTKAYSLDKSPAVLNCLFNAHIKNKNIESAKDLQAEQKKHTADINKSKGAPDAITREMAQKINALEQEEKKRTYYAVLGVSNTEEDKKIRARYLDLVKQCRTGMAGCSDKDRDRKLQQITEAYTVLKDPQKRREYDKNLRMWGGHPGEQEYTQGGNSQYEHRYRGQGPQWIDIGQLFNMFGGRQMGGIGGRFGRFEFYNL